MLNKDTKKKRNFCIIAHIDHGKSTLADRFLERTNMVEEREMKDQFLDSMDLEREKGITIKAQTITLPYRGHNLNLIDTPGHVDFTYEVSRSLAACEGALLVVDAVQGVEAQTLANVYLARENDLKIIPVINKMDLPQADAQSVKEQLIELEIEPDDAILASAKEGEGIDEILDAIIEEIPPPQGRIDNPTQALVFDSAYDSYRGVIPHLRVFEGDISAGDEVKLLASEKTYEVEEVGIFNPRMEETDYLKPGDVGYLIANIKNIRNCRVGETITDAQNSAESPLPGYREIKPMVFSGLYPSDNDDYSLLEQALEKLQLNDAALRYESESSSALGYGFRCGFLGLLHMEVVQERLEREYDIDLITTAPSVIYKVVKTDGETVKIENPSHFPPKNKIEWVEEPYVRAELGVPEDHIGAVMELCENNRGEFEEMNFLDRQRVILNYKIPMSEIITDFFDRLKSCSQGYATLDYEQIGYRESDLVKLDILVNKEQVDALSLVVPRDKAEKRGRAILKKLKDEIPRQLFEIPLQASIGSNIVAREDIPAHKKDVTEGLYGGDFTRKRKQLEKQKEGKKRMKKVGSVDIPQEAFMAVLEKNNHN